MILELAFIQTCRACRGTPLFLGSAFSQNLRGTPLAICDFGIYSAQKTVGGHPLRFMILELAFIQTCRACRGTPLFLGSAFSQNLRGTPLAICDFGIYSAQKTVGGHPLRFMILELAFIQT